jgi:hypothetical protein
MLFKFSALCLVGRHGTVWATPPALYALDILEMGSCVLLRLTWATIPTVAGMIGTCHQHRAFLH